MEDRIIETPPKRATPKIGQDGFGKRMKNFGRRKTWELILSFCLPLLIWKYLDDDEELQIGQPAAVVASFLKTTTILTPICLRKASWIPTFTDRFRIRKEPETAPKRINRTIKNRNHHRLAPNLEHLASIRQNKTFYSC